MAITSNCAEIIITNPQGSVSFNKLITTTELSPAKTIYSEDRVYLIQNSENVPQTFWWNLEKAIADGYADLEELYDYFVAEIANQCGGGGGGGIESIVEGTNITVDDTDPQNPIISATGGGGSPAGSNNQIQINQSGAFFADSTFQKSDTDFNVGLDHTAQSAVTFTGSGLDDLIVSGLFTGTAPTTYTVTIDGVNIELIAIDSSTITGGTFAVADVVTNGLGGTATVNSVVEVEIGDSLEAYTYLGVTVTAGTFGSSETIDNGTGVTGTGSYEVGDTFGFTDGTVTYSDAPVSGGVLLSNGIKAEFGSPTGHTLTDEWTWTYSYVNQNVLDFSNNDYKFQSVLGTDTFGYQIGDNLLGFGLKGSVNTWVNGSDFSLSGTYLQGTTLTIGTTIQMGSATSASLLEIDKSYTSISDGTDSGNYNLRVNQLALSNTIGGIDYGIEQSAGAVTVGNLLGGNNTKITIDDVNEQITISNLPAYDDDTAAGVAGLTAGMVYMTTGSGSAPLNAAGILMIKQ